MKPPRDHLRTAARLLCRWQRIPYQHAPQMAVTIHAAHLALGLACGDLWRAAIRSLARLIDWFDGR